MDAHNNDALHNMTLENMRQCHLQASSARTITTITGNEMPCSDRGDDVALSSFHPASDSVANIGNSTHHYSTAVVSKRKRMLQRQRPASAADFIEDMEDYAADLEENDIDDDDDDVDDVDTHCDDDDIPDNEDNNIINNHNDQFLKMAATMTSIPTPTATTTMMTPTSPLNVLVAAQHKRLLFQNQPSRSKMALQFSTPSPPHSAPIGSPLSQCNCACNIANLPAHSFSHQATRSSSASSTTSLESRLRHQDSFDSTTPTRDLLQNRRSRPTLGLLKRDNSIHSDSSRYSSVDSLLEARKPDPEAILINLGFGPAVSEDILSRIPARFLKPSQVRGIDTDAFVKRLQLANTLADHSVLGYRGLTGNPDMPPSSIVAKIMQRFEVNERKKSMGCIEQMI